MKLGHVRLAVPEGLGSGTTNPVRSSNATRSQTADATSAPPNVAGDSGSGDAVCSATTSVDKKLIVSTDKGDNAPYLPALPQPGIAAVRGQGAGAYRLALVGVIFRWFS